MILSQEMKSSWIPSWKCKVTKDALQKQEEQEMTIKKCRDKVDCMTDEM